jgi:hypothetical protein
MKNYTCQCGSKIYFYNSMCLQCGLRLGFDPGSQLLVALTQDEDEIWTTPQGNRYRLCKNWIEHNICNWLVPADSNMAYCLSCDLNRTIPGLSTPLQIELWGNLERAKQHLISNLLSLNLPIISKRQNFNAGLAFDILEDRRQNPNVFHEFVTTGHKDGIITINLAEADDVAREKMRLSMGEAYRTMLGHLRHESGHYYFDLLIRSGAYLSAFRDLFGSDLQDYQKSMDYHYHSINYLNGETNNKLSEGYITPYARSHPLEDWAECWSHYLHIVDTCETAIQYGVITESLLERDFPEWLDDWNQLTTLINALNRSLGLRDAYPFILSPAVVTKIHFVHRVIHSH